MRPQPRVFVEAFQYLLVVCTTIEVRIIDCSLALYAALELSCREAFTRQIVFKGIFCEKECPRQKYTFQPSAKSLCCSTE